MKIIETNYPFMWHSNPYSHGYSHGEEDRDKKRKYRPEIFLSEWEVNLYKKGYRDGQKSNPDD